MGQNSKARRDARKKQQARQSRPPVRRTEEQTSYEFTFDAAGPDSPVGTGTRRGTGPYGGSASADEAFRRRQQEQEQREFRAKEEMLERSNGYVATFLRQLGVKSSATDAARAVRLLHNLGVPTWALTLIVADLIERLIATARRNGWGPTDLVDVVERMVGPEQRPAMVGWLRVSSAMSAADQEQIRDLGPARTVDLLVEEDQAVALRLLALIAYLPPTPNSAQSSTARPPRRNTATTKPEAKAKPREMTKLAQVRALLAKAESTNHPEEAETLTAKAQELISRYSLERLLEHDAAEERRAGQLTSRRLWLEAPYVDAKSTLVHQVAHANRCRSVHHPELALSIVIGADYDIDAVDLLLTSLLAQAQRALLVHAAQSRAGGRSRSRAFRHSFLLSFAIHIGQRLQAADSQSVKEVGAALVPVLRDHNIALDDLMAEAFPQTFSRTASITDAAGWESGRVAAELAEIGDRGRVTA